MTTDTVLSLAQIDAALDSIDCLFWDVSTGSTEKFARAIEQAVLQSPEVQRLREDAGRYRWLRNDCLDKAPFGKITPVVFDTDDSFNHEDEALMGDALDKSIDAALGNQP